MASTFVSITTSAYTCAEFMLVWKLTFFVIPASAAIFLRYLLARLARLRRGYVAERDGLYLTLYVN